MGSLDGFPFVSSHGRRPEGTSSHPQALFKTRVLNVISDLGVTLWPQHSPVVLFAHHHGSTIIVKTLERFAHSIPPNTRQSCDQTASLCQPTQTHLHRHALPFWVVSLAVQELSTGSHQSQMISTETLRQVLTPSSFMHLHHS